MALIAPLAGVLGLLIGSFLNVVIHRVPRGESVVRPGSRCPTCAAPIAARHNIPVAGWLLVRGRCVHCGSAVSRRYPLVELGTSLLFVALALWLGRLDQLGALPAYLYFAAIAVALAVIDVDVRRLPDAIVLPSYPALAGLLTFAAVWQDDGPALIRAAAGAALLLLGYAAIAFTTPAAMGFGDVKLAGLIGGVLAYLSWPVLVVGAFAGFFLGAAYGVALIAIRRGTRKTAVPFGPFMLAGALLGIFVGEPVATAWVSLIALVRGLG